MKGKKTRLVEEGFNSQAVGPRCTCGINSLFKSGAKSSTVKLKLKPHLFLLSKSSFRRL